MNKEEDILTGQVCAYISLQYPDVIFTQDSSGIKLPIGLAKKMKNRRSSKGLPDIWILEPKGGYHGLFLELKKEGEQLQLKTSDKWKNEHIVEQAEILLKLTAKGYWAWFAVGFDEAKQYIDNYMAL